MFKIPVVILLITPLIGFAPTLAVQPKLPTKVSPTVEQTPESILGRAIQAIGGRRELAQITSFRLHGIMRLADGRPVVDVELSTSEGGKVLGILSFVGFGQSRFGSDGVTAWEQNVNPKQESTWTLIDQATLSQKVQQINWLEWFTMLPSTLSEMHFEGSTLFDGQDSWQISILGEDGRVQLAFFSKETHRPLGRRTIEQTPNGDTIVDVYFRDWNRVDNLLLFHTVSYSRDKNEVTLKIDSIELDKVPDSLFTIPEAVKVLRDQP